MDKIIKAKLILPAYLTAEARDLIRSVNTRRYFFQKKTIFLSN